MSKKYSFHDYKAPSKEKIPDDLNELPLNTAMKLDPSGDLKAFMLNFQDNKLFGDINFISPEDHRLHATFEFQSGMCKKFKLIKFMNKESHTHSMQTILNSKIDFKRKSE